MFGMNHAIRDSNVGRATDQDALGSTRTNPHVIDPYVADIANDNAGTDSRRERQVANVLALRGGQVVSRLRRSWRSYRGRGTRQPAAGAPVQEDDSGDRPKPSNGDHLCDIVLFLVTCAACRCVAVEVRNV